MGKPKHKHMNNQNNGENQGNKNFVPKNHQNIPMKHQNNKKGKHSFKRIAVDPSKQYYTPESRESWGPNVKGKKFKKEKGKKKRCPGMGLRIDGEVKSIKFNQQ